jgi:putative peptidoglycan lipid II flippase
MDSVTGRRPSLARGAALITVATAVSRITGFARVVAVAAALGTTFLANTYHTANTAPNLLFELVAAGVLTSVFVPTFVQYLVREDHEAGWDAANALTTVALVALTALAVLVGLSAEWIMRALTLGVEPASLRSDEIALGAAFLRLFAPQVVFYGAGMIMTGALHAHRKFGMAAVAPIFNNLVVIAVYVAYAVMRGDRPPTVEGITAAETFLLGAGTTLGVVAMTICLVPQLRRLGWRFRPRFEPGHPAVKRAARLGVWALSYAGGYQAGLVVVLLLANRIEGGVAAYHFAYTFFYLPHALFGVPIFHVLFPEMSEHSARGDERALASRLRAGLEMLAFVLVPIAAFLILAADPVADTTLRYGVMTGGGAALVARVLAAFAVGLPAYSAFLVFTRAFYALGDTKTPALVNVATVAVSSLVGALLFFAVEREWAVAGLAAGHSIAFLAGSVVLGRLLTARTGPLSDGGLTRTLVVCAAVSVAAAVPMVAARWLLPETTNLEALVNLGVTALAGAGSYLLLMRGLKSPELARVASLVRRNAHA